jgi:hypothetical protein
MKNFLLLACLAPAFLLLSCIPVCVQVTGPNDVPYSILTDPACSSDYCALNGGHLINSALDFDAFCPGGTVPSAWDFVNKSYIVVCTGHTASAPYLAGVGNDPADPNQIIVTIGLPCLIGAVPAIYAYKTFTLEIAKTAKTLKVVEKDELH